MNFAGFLKAILNIIGLIAAIRGWLKNRKAAAKAQRVADSPTTRDELEDKLRKGEL